MVSHSLLTVSLLLVAGLLELCPSRKSEFLEGDMTISHTCGNTVSIPMVLLYYLLTVLLLIALIFIFVNRVNQWKVLLYCILLSTRALSSVLLLVNILKVFTGRPRPCFFDLCGYPRTNHIYGVMGQIGVVSKCTNSYHAINDAFRSFPSGHTMLSSSSFTLCYFLLRRVFYDSKKWNHQLIIALHNVLLVLSFLVSVMISVTRIFDYRHFASDVVCGYILGVVVTVFSEQNLDRNCGSGSEEDNEVCEKEELIRIMDV